MDSPGGHGAQRVKAHLERGAFAGSRVVAQQEIENHRPRKLGCVAEAAVLGIIGRSDLPVRRREDSFAQLAARDIGARDLLE